MITTHSPKKINEIINIFVNKYKTNPNVIAILISWSYIHSIPDKNSDLDIYILLKKSPTRERWNTRINWVEIEYFINPVDQVKHYFKTEVWDNSPMTAHMFANSKILYQKDNTVNKLIKEAKNILKKKKKSMNKINIEFSKYSIDDTAKDLEDSYLKNDIFSFYIIANLLLSESLEIFLKVHRLSKEKSKRLQNQLKSIDNNFEKIYSSALLEKDLNKRFKALNKLVSYIENILGWKRSKERSIKSKCTF